VTMIARRTLLVGIGVMPFFASSISQATNAQSKETAMNTDAFAYEHKPVPLPFDPASLRGISERLIQSHWENNYVGASKALNTVRSKLSQALGADTPPYVYTGLKREQAIRTGSVVLHDLYFGNLGGDGKAPADLRTRIGGAFGTFDQWESEFRKIGQGLGGGSGWVVLGYNEHLKLLENYWLADHATNPAHTRPVLVMDMYEHAYHLDYGAVAGKYIDAFFVNINWDAIAERLETA
jgi:superoxide dismutase, Fe-Mn family